MLKLDSNALTLFMLFAFPFVKNIGILSQIVPYGLYHNKTTGKSD